MQCPGIIACFPEKCPSVPIPGEISRFPGQFWLCPETAFIRVVTPRFFCNLQSFCYVSCSLPEKKAESQVETRGTIPRPGQHRAYVCAHRYNINTAVWQLWIASFGLGSFSPAISIFIRPNNVETAIHACHNAEMIWLCACVWLVMTRPRC